MVGQVEDTGDTATPVVGPADLGSLIRRRRKALGLTQDGLAGLSGVSHKFINEVEQGKPTAAIGKVMRVVEMLGIDLIARPR